VTEKILGDESKIETFTVFVNPELAFCALDNGITELGGVSTFASNYLVNTVRTAKMVRFQNTCNIHALRVEPKVAFLTLNKSTISV
jgi:hypothetical protein